jgi:hypothetical protein
MKPITQCQYDEAHTKATRAIESYAAGLILLFELKEVLSALDVPTPTQGVCFGLTDPATGLSF